MTIVDTTRVTITDIPNAMVRGSADFPGRDPQHVTIPAATVVTVNRHPVPGYVTLFGTVGGVRVLVVMRANDAEMMTSGDDDHGTCPACLSVACHGWCELD